MGEDLDLCWRAQVAGLEDRRRPRRGGRAPRAAGQRRATAHRDRGSGHGGADPPVAHAAPPALDDAHLLRLAVPASRPSRCSWSSRQARSWSPSSGGTASGSARSSARGGGASGDWAPCDARHRLVAKARVLDDHDVRRLQVAGASRLQTFGSRLVHEGVDVARGALVPATIAVAHEADEPLDHTVGFGAAFSDDASFDELDDLGHRVAPPARRLPRDAAHPGRRGGRCRGVLPDRGAQPRRVAPAARRPARPARLVGRDLAATSSRRGRSTGVGTGAPGAPGFGVLGFAGTFVFGRMGVLPRAALVCAIPLGAIGVWRLLRGVGVAPRAARRRDRLRVPRARAEPRRGRTGRRALRARAPAIPHPSAPRRRGRGAVRPRRRGRTRRPSGRGARGGCARMVGLGALEALVVAARPRRRRRVPRRGDRPRRGRRRGGGPSWRPRARHRARRLRHRRGAPRAAHLRHARGGTRAGSTCSARLRGRGRCPGSAGCVRGAIGPFGASPLSWLLPAAALLALVVGRGERLVLAARFAGHGAWPRSPRRSSSRGTSPARSPPTCPRCSSPTPSPSRRSSATGVAAFEAGRRPRAVRLAPARRRPRRCSSSRWARSPSSPRRRRGGSTSPSRATTCSSAASRRRSSAARGRCGSATRGRSRSRAGPSSRASRSRRRPTGCPAARRCSRRRRAARPVCSSDDVVAAMRGETVHLGRLLAAAGIAYVVVVSATAPALAGQPARPSRRRRPRALLPALHHQLDLAAEPLAGGRGRLREHGVARRRSRTAPSHSTPPRAPGASARRATGHPPSALDLERRGRRRARCSEPSPRRATSPRPWARPRSSARARSAGRRRGACRRRAPRASRSTRGRSTSCSRGSCSRCWLGAVALAVGPERLGRARRALRPRRARGAPIDEHEPDEQVAPAQPGDHALAEEPA